MDYIERKISDKKAIALLARNGIEVNDEEAAIILSFLYLMAKIHNRKMTEDTEILKENSNKSNNYPTNL